MTYAGSGGALFRFAWLARTVSCLQRNSARWPPEGGGVRAGVCVEGAVVVVIVCLGRPSMPSGVMFAGGRLGI